MIVKTAADNIKGYLQKEIPEYECNRELKIIIRSKGEGKFLSKIHEKLGHPGINVMYNTIKLFIHVQKLKEKITQHPKK